jgi:hypothetical protein
MKPKPPGLTDAEWEALTAKLPPGNGEDAFADFSPDDPEWGDDLEMAAVVAEIHVPAGVQVVEAGELAWLESGLSYRIDGVRESGGQVVLEITVVDA